MTPPPSKGRHLELWRATSIFAIAHGAAGYWRTAIPTGAAATDHVPLLCELLKRHCTARRTQSAITALLRAVTATCSTSLS